MTDQRNNSSPVMHIIKAKNKNDKEMYFFCDDYAVNQNGLDVLFENEWYFLNGFEVVSDTLQEITNKNVLIFNRETLIKNQDIRYTYFATVYGSFLIPK